MIQGKTDGRFLNIQAGLAWGWSQDEQANAVCPATEDETTNRFHPYGVNHVPDGGLTGNYVVLIDLSDSQTAPSIGYGYWPIQMRAFSVNSLLEAQRMVIAMRDRVIPAIQQQGFATELGGVCGVEVVNRQVGQVQRHFYAQATFRFRVAG